MPIASAARINEYQFLQIMPLNQVSKHAVCCWGAAYIAQTDKHNPYWRSNHH
jgi:hypothetical protein